MKPWTMTNGTITLPLCDSCQQPVSEGHINCGCERNHPENCTRPPYNELWKKLRELDAALQDEGDNQCDYGHTTRTETRLYRSGGDNNIILCVKHYNDEYGKWALHDRDYQMWSSLDVYREARPMTATEQEISDELGEILG